MIRFAFGLAILMIVFSSCNNASESSTEAAPSLTAEEQLERDLEMYENVWFEFLNNGDTLAVSAEHFTEDVTIITDQGNIVGIDGVRGFYMNYLNGFSDIEFTIVDAFGRATKLSSTGISKAHTLARFLASQPQATSLICQEPPLSPCGMAEWPANRTSST